MATYSKTMVSSQQSITDFNVYFAMLEGGGQHITPYSVINSAQCTITMDSTISIKASMRVQLSDTTGEPNGSTVCDWGDCLGWDEITKTGDFTKALNLNGVNAGKVKKPYLTVVCKGSLRTYMLKHFSFSFDYTPSKTEIRVEANNSNYGTVSGGGIWENTKQEVSAASIMVKTSISASPKPGYKFVRWSDGVKSSTREITIKSEELYAETSVFTYVAEFAPLTYVNYDSILSFRKWKNEGISPSGADVSSVTDRGFTLTCREGASEGVCASPYFPVEEGKSYKVDIDITGINWDVYIFFCNENGEWVKFSDSAANRYSYGDNHNRIFTAPEADENQLPVVMAQIRVDANGEGNSVNFENFRIYPSQYEYMSDTVPPEERSDEEVFSQPTPSREGYEFTGWFSAPEGGYLYPTDTFPQSDITLYSQWSKRAASKIFTGKSLSQAYLGALRVSVYCGTCKLI